MGSLHIHHSSYKRICGVSVPVESVHQFIVQVACFQLSVRKKYVYNLNKIV